MKHAGQKGERNRGQDSRQRGQHEGWAWPRVCSGAPVNASLALRVLPQREAMRNRKMDEGLALSLG